jgi:type VI secretion system protein ImpH
VIRALLADSRAFSFFQAVRLLELSRPDAAPLGGRGPASREAVRLRPHTGLEFQAAEVTQVESPSAEGGPWRLTTTLPGLYGASSPLPSIYSEDILQRELEFAPDEDPARLFLDVLNHRLLSLIYRAWSKYRWAFRFRSGGEDAISRCVFHLIGLASPESRALIGVPPQRLLRYAGFLTQLPRTASGLAGVLTDWFDGVPVRVEQCLERWVPVVTDDQNRLGVRNSELSQNFVVGVQVRDRAGKFRLRIGPLPDLAGFLAFLPIGEHHRALGALVRFLAPDPLEYDFVLGLSGPAVPELRIASDDRAARLGYSSWLRADREATEKWERFWPPPLGE